MELSLNEAINANVPLKQKRVREYSKAKWLSPVIPRLMKLRDRLLKRATLQFPGLLVSLEASGKQSHRGY